MADDREESMTDILPGNTPRPVIEEVDLLMKEYAILKTDQNMQAQSFKNHVRNAQILLTIIAGLLAVALSNRGLNSIDLFEFEVGAVIFSFVLTTVTYFLVHDTLEANFAVQALAERIVSIEERVNTLLHRRALIWESIIANQLWTPLRAQGVLHPIRVMYFYEAALILAVTCFTLCVYYWAWHLPNTSVSGKAVLAVLSAFSVGSLIVAVYVWYGINHHLRKEVRRLIEDA
jgi:hypothetical protein